MAKSAQINIRFDMDTDNELKRTAKALGMSKSALVRHLTRTFLDDVKRSGGLQINPDWRRMLAAAEASAQHSENSPP